MGDSALPLLGSSIATPLAAGWVTDYPQRGVLRAATPLSGPSTISGSRTGSSRTRASRLPGGRRLGARDLAAFHRAFGRDRLAARGRLDAPSLLAGGARTARRVVSGGLGRPPPARAWDRLRDTGAARPIRSVESPPRPSRSSHSPARAARAPARRDVRARAAHRRGRDAAVPLRSGSLARHGKRPRMLHGVAPGRARGSDVRDRAERRPSGAATGVHPRLRHLHARPDAGRGADGAARSPDGPCTRARRRRKARGAGRVDHARPASAGSRHQPAPHRRRGTIRDIGAWDPLPRHLQLAYDRGGGLAQREFWSPQPVAASMLAQLAALTR